MKPLLLAFFAFSAAYAEVRLPALISDHMVLQQGVPVRIWGKADPGEGVKVEFQGQTATTAADASGHWAAWLKPLKAGGPAEMIVAGRNRIAVADVLVGEVWVGSGQSNMGMTVGASNNAEQELARADHPKLRLFEVRRRVADQPAEDVDGAWTLANAETVKRTSAAGYFFSRELLERLGVPIGFIHSSWGGTPVQSWMSRPVIEADPALRFLVEDWDRILAAYPAAKERYDGQFAKWKQEASAAKAEGRTPPRMPNPPQGPGHQNTPSGLYNAMIAPLVSYTIRGAIWYQGEANASPRHAFVYRRMFRTMIEDWWQQWDQGPFPFLFVQLANFRSNGWWPLLRESQTDALELRRTGMAVTVDIGDPNDIHPKNKQEVGRRLGLAARAIAYGENVVSSGPLYRQYTVEGPAIRIWFDHTGGGLEARGDRLAGFVIAGPDRNFVPADARIDGATVIVSSPQVTAPAAVRYAFEDSPDGNLYNREGLPASSFRTDRWEFAPVRK